MRKIVYNTQWLLNKYVFTSKNKFDRISPWITSNFPTPKQRVEMAKINFCCVFELTAMLSKSTGQPRSFVAVEKFRKSHFRKRTQWHLLWGVFYRSWNVLQKKKNTVSFKTVQLFGTLEMKSGLWNAWSCDREKGSNGPLSRGTPFPDGVAHSFGDDREREGGEF